ncbi:MAG: hypothetical protein JO097_03385 [Acidobacteriaceae bacterium]|nr:hypothetical protein [Acidobacteriaceae bacterium]MBV9294774.1 hypothetical protein [Acidobacteriaceae bacterium]MBV9767334.1 hypothetical protein [Acidobacteriaceae bacterium]
MAKPSIELGALINLISQGERILATTTLPEGSKRAHELLRAALALTDDLEDQSKHTLAASVPGRKGGSATAERYGSDHFRELAVQRKSYAGRRPKKTAE